MLWGMNEAVLLLGGIAAFLIAIEVGFRLGKRHLAPDDTELAGHVSALQSALLGLLALLLGFTFAMSISRYDVRKQLVLQEANAIGTAYLRASFLPDPQEEQVRGLLRDYVDARLAFFAAGVDPEKLAAAARTAAGLEERLWRQAEAATLAPVNPVAVGLFVQSLNDVIDVNEERQVALENHVPETVIALLFLVAVISMGFTGYGYGLQGRRRHASTAVFAVLIAVVLVVIMDIDRPRRGLITVSQSSLERLQTSVLEPAP